MSENARRNAIADPRSVPVQAASGPRRWIITLAITGALLGVMYGVTAHRAEVQDEHRQIEMQKDAAPPAIQPGG
ncbi:MAG: hypothetical protein QOF14_5158 [Hyphomicrobiales bacterium]|jgi:hypothetical protein|nr:hypothetical protein [Hyphomicrobiales bacterium]